MKTQIEIPAIALKALQTQKFEALKTVQKIDDLLKSFGASPQVNKPHNKNRRKRGSSFRLDSAILSQKGEWTVDDAAAELVEAKLIGDVEERQELFNAIARLVKSAKISHVKSGRGRAKASYKVAKSPIPAKSE